MPVGPAGKPWLLALSSRPTQLVGPLPAPSPGALPRDSSSCPLLRLQDLSSGYWVLVVHFTRREAIRQIEVLQHVATNLGRSE